MCTVLEVLACTTCHKQFCVICINAYETKVFIGLCKRTFKTVLQSLIILRSNTLLVGFFSLICLFCQLLRHRFHNES